MTVEVKFFGAPPGAAVDPFPPLPTACPVSMVDTDSAGSGNMFSYLGPTSQTGNLRRETTLVSGVFKHCGFPDVPFQRPTYGFRTLDLPQSASPQAASLIWRGMNPEFIADNTITGGDYFGPCARIMVLGDVPGNLWIGTTVSQRQECYAFQLNPARLISGGAIVTTVGLVHIAPGGLIAKRTAVLAGVPAPGSVFRIQAVNVQLHDYSQVGVCIRCFIDNIEPFAAYFDTDRLSINQQRIVIGSPGVGTSNGGFGNSVDSAALNSPTGYQMTWDSFTGSLGEAT